MLLLKSNSILPLHVTPNPDGEAPSYEFCSIWLNLSRQHSPMHDRIHPASSIHTRDPVPLAAIHAHAITLQPPCSTSEVCVVDARTPLWTSLEFQGPATKNRFSIHNQLLLSAQHEIKRQ